MKHIHLCILFSFLLCSFLCHGQEKKYDMSAPIDLKQTGVNKVLCMSNGNTMLFHFEPTDAITVKVFDSTHKETASRKDACRILDTYIIKDAIFKGLFEINGEAVLFIEQEHLSRHGLVRLRFNGKDGSLVEEKLVNESPSATKPTRYYVMKNKENDSYAILFSTDVPQFLDCRIFVAYYNNKHESVREVPISVDRKKYDYLKVVDAEWQPNGISISLSVAKLNENGTAVMNEDNRGTAAIYDHHLLIYYIPKNDTTASSVSVDASTKIFPYFSNYTYNPFANALNFLLLSYKDVAYKNGYEWRPAALIEHLFFKIDAGTMEISYKMIRNKAANEYLQKKKDTTALYEGIPINMYTNENGLSTVISQSFSRHTEAETHSRYNRFTYLGNIALTQFDDDGNEIWGAVLPLSQRYRSYRRYYVAYELSKKWQTQSLFADLPEQVYERQFVSLNTYDHNKNLYVVFNDNDKNFNSSIDKPEDTVYSFNTTNACYYRMNRKKEITKHFLFGEPAANEYKCSFIEGADFDERFEGFFVYIFIFDASEEIFE